MAASIPDLDLAQANGFASLALDCIHREYPNKISHVLNSSVDVQSPRQLTPAFFGCYDWHSAVHNHWVLARLLRLFPDAPFAPRATQALSQGLTEGNIAQEVRYLAGEGRESFERPYGLAWLLQLAAELKQWGTPDALRWSTALAPLETAVISRVVPWLPRLQRPIRTGEHNNTAFALGLMLDYARLTHHSEFALQLERRIAQFYFKDTNCPASYEPSGEDFLSPCLSEADLMRRLLPGHQFATWLTSFLPIIQFEPTEIGDGNDGKIGHLIGLDLSRAWMLGAMAAALPSGDPRIHTLSVLSQTLAQSGLSRIDSAKYHGAHWLGTFAVYLLTRRSHS